MNTLQAAAQRTPWGSRVQVPDTEMRIMCKSSTARISLTIECCINCGYVLSDRLQDLASSQNYLVPFSQIHK